MSDFDAIARRQRGYIDLAQLASADLSRGQVARLVGKGHFHRPHAGVFRTGSAPPTWVDKVQAALLAAGGDARAMGRAAARLYGLDGADGSAVVEITVSVLRGPVPHGVIVHRTRQTDPSLTSSLNGMAISSINQTLLEYAWKVKAMPMVERAVEDAIDRGRTSEGALLRFVASRGKGVPGVTHLRSVLLNRPDGRAAHSVFEVIVYDIIREYGLRQPVRRLLVPVPPDQKFELDLAYENELVAVEPMGRKWHRTASQVRNDALRRAALESIGWSVVPVFWPEAVTTPWLTAARIGATLRSARI
ncbi:MAG: type IV toxin-antitoxin system AbiEi family antitoxin domain-containing protein [Actinobacteria bacterium]|nr:type IV toxin-antitoxin system AbiEi family antitoxin domain-containing protein [Actinomycetota bacterium]